MDTLTIIAIISFIIIVGYLGEYGFLKFKFPDILLLMFIGFMITFFLRLNVNSLLYNYMSLAATISLIIILFEGGVSLHLSTIRDVIKESLAMAFLYYSISFFLITVVLYILFGMNISLSLLYGSILSAPSVAIVIPLINRSSIEERKRHLYIVSATILDLLSIVITISFVEYYPISMMTIIPVLESLATNIFAQLFFGLLAGLFWIELLRKIERVELSYMLTLGFLFLIYAFSDLIWKNGMITAITFGIVLGNNSIFRKLLNLKEYAIDENIFKFNKEVVFFMRTAIFVAIGSIFVLAKFSLEVIYYILTIVVIIYIFQVVVDYLVEKRVPNKYVHLLIPRGLTQIVLGIIVITNIDSIGVSFIQNIAIVIIITNVISSLILYIKK